MGSRGFFFRVDGRILYGVFIVGGFLFLSFFLSFLHDLDWTDEDGFFSVKELCHCGEAWELLASLIYLSIWFLGRLNQ